MRGILLETQNWRDAEALLTPESLVVMPLGAQLKEHGPHLPLNTDWLTAEWFGAQVVEHADVIMLPTVSWSFYPAFVEYPGSVTLSLDTAVNVIVEICDSIRAHGPKRIYVINTGVSTRRALARAAEQLYARGMLLHFTDIGNVGSQTVRKLEQQNYGTHADEIETSMLLAIAPNQVNMSLACADGSEGQGRLTRKQNQPGVYSPSGVIGDARLATPEKGQAILAAMLQDILSEIETLRSAPLP